MASQGSEWQHGLTDCSPCDSCLLSTFLPCILYGRTSSHLRAPAEEVETCNSDCMLFTFVQYFTASGFILNTVKRGEIRAKLGIEGSCCGDFCTSVWCLCCALIQQDKEVKARLAPTGPNTTGYQPVSEEMYMPPPTYPEAKQS